MNPWLQLIRWKNLLIIGITQTLIYFFLFKINSIGGDIAGYDVALFIICTLIIAAGGNVINDLVDIKADFVNRPFEKCYILNYIGLSPAIKFYYILICSGGIIALYLSIKYEFYYSFLIYPLCVYLFWIYSQYLQCKGYWGNVLVSLFISLVVMIMPYFFSYNLDGTFFSAEYEKVWDRICLLAGFAFVVNLMREIIKDIEDVRGDELIGCQTGCVKYGTRVSLVIVKSIVVLTLLGSVYLLFNIFGNWVQSLFIICIIIPLLVFLYLLFSKEINFAKMSMLCKVYMLIGLIYFIFA
ncbi:MAG: UbiA family prenyltransferase [Saprospiraceae bacterium]|nr:UbiA family prenyltransferase [Saprospiraceae bacterium]